MKYADVNLVITLFLAATALPGQYKTPNPQVAKIVSEVSDEKITEILKKLESFGTRNILSTQDNPTRGVGAARKWIYEEFRSYSPKLEVSFDQYKLKKIEGRASRVPRDVDLYNVVAVLPGTTNKEQRIIISGHYDSIVIGPADGRRACYAGRGSADARSGSRCSRSDRRWQRHGVRDGVGPRPESLRV
jgi:hypothetical protein